MTLYNPIYTTPDQQISMPKGEAVYTLVADGRFDILEPLPFYGVLTFSMFRGADESGVSGTGKVLEGVVFSDKTTVVRWVTDKAPNSVTVFGNEGDTTVWYKFVNVHVQPHPFNEVTLRFSNNRYWKQEADPRSVFEHDYEQHYGHARHRYRDKCSYCSQEVAGATEAMREILDAIQ